MHCPGGVLLIPSCPGVCSSSQLWVPQHATEALAFCSTDVVLLALDPQSMEGHQKSICLNNGPFQQPDVPPAQSHMCTQPLRPFWNRAVFGVGQAGHRGAPLAHHSAQPHCQWIRASRSQHGQGAEVMTVRRGLHMKRAYIKGFPTWKKSST